MLSWWAGWLGPFLRVPLHCYQSYLLTIFTLPPPPLFLEQKLQLTTLNIQYLSQTEMEEYHKFLKKSKYDLSWSNLNINRRGDICIIVIV